MPDARDAGRWLRAHRGELAGVGFLVALAAWLRLPDLGGWLLSWDDLWHLQDALQPTLADVVARNLREQVHGPLHYVTLHALAAWLQEPFGLRWISLAPGLLLVPACYALGRALLGPAAGFVLAAVAACADRVVVVTQGLRPYAAMLLWVVLAALCLVRARSASGRRTRWRMGWYACAALAAWTQIAAAIPLAALAAARALGCARERGLPAALAGLGATALALGPPVAWALAQLRFASARVGPEGGGLDAFVAHFFYFRPMLPETSGAWLLNASEVMRFLVLPPDASPWVAWSLVAATALGASLLALDRRWFVLGFAVGPLALSGALGALGLFPFAATRHCVFLVPFLAIPWAYLAERVRGRLPTPGALLAGFALLALLVDLDPGRHRRPGDDFDTRVDDLEATFAHLEVHARPGDVVVVNRVGMQYLNLAGWLAGGSLEHVAHPADHATYPYERWVLPGGEEHVYRGLRVWACDGPHLWSAWLGDPSGLRRCLAALGVRRQGAVERVWFLIEKPDLFGAFGAAQPLGVFPAGSVGRELLRRARADPLWRVLFTGQERMRTPTTATFALPFDGLAEPD